MSNTEMNDIPAPIDPRDPEDQPTEQYVMESGDKSGLAGADSSNMMQKTTGTTNDSPHVGNLENDEEEEEEENQDDEKVDYVPSAIPQEREVEHAKSYFAHKLACGTLLVMAIIVVIGGVCGSGHCSGGGGGGGGSKASPVTSAPTSFRSTLSAEFEAKLLEAFGIDYLLEDDNEFIDVRRRALEWILDEDPMQLESDSPNLIQRYSLTVFYFQTSWESPWKNCDPSGPDLCYYTLWGMEVASAGNAWLSDRHECLWASVECRGFGTGNRSVTSISLFDNGLHGSLPTELFGLANLQDLRLVQHNFTGTIPTEIAIATTLETLELGLNQFTGPLPAEMFEPLRNLVSIKIARNSLTGSIPTSIGFYTSGQLLALHGNDLSGSIPAEIYSLSNLRYLTLYENEITGTIATDIAEMESLYYIGLGQTLVSGTIPSEIGLMETLIDVDLPNTKLQGTLPEELFTGAAPLKYLDISNCAFSGTISTNIAQLTGMNHLNLADNDFEGTIPTEISALIGLIDFSIKGNNFSGTFPESVCMNSFANKKEVSDLVADCLPDEGTDAVAMECHCCSECCNANTGICLEV